MKVFAQIVNGFYSLHIFKKSSILDARQDSQFASKASYDIAEKAAPQVFDRVLNLPLIISQKPPAISYFSKTIGYLFTKFD